MHTNNGGLLAFHKCKKPFLFVLIILSINFQNCPTFQHTSCPHLMIPYVYKSFTLGKHHITKFPEINISILKYQGICSRSGKHQAGKCVVQGLLNIITKIIKEKKKIKNSTFFPAVHYYLTT